MLAAVLSGIILALVLIPSGRIFKGKYSVLLTLLPASLFAYFLSFIPRVSGGEVIFFRYEWVPTFGVNLNFSMSGLSLLFALMISGVGMLVFYYSSAYMKGHRYIVRFFAYLSVFMAAMLGMVLSDNLIALFVFWELTSISSFFLIGFNSEDPASRKSAITALAVTGSGGLLLLAAFILLGHIGGTFEFTTLLADGTDFTSHRAYPLILLLLLAGAFTKSGQFPFHFWLPGAMKAPTPVSTYLHSATMVKAGVFLLLKFSPLLGDHIYWNAALTVFGGVTMLYCAWHTLFRTDMKSILAYSTLSALGIMVFMIGAGTDAALTAAVTFVAVHALYKATLFLVTGIVDHETGTRDVTRLSGLGRVLMPAALAAGLAALSNAGIPPTFGFIGKDLIYEASLHADYLPGVLTAGAVLTKILLAYAGYVVGVKPFIGKRLDIHEKVHLPSVKMWLPPLILAIGGLIFGVFPGIASDHLIRGAALTSGVSNFHALGLFHGFNAVFALSVITIAAGIGLYFAIAPSREKTTWIARFDAVSSRAIMERTVRDFYAISDRWTRFFQNGYLRFYIITILMFFILLTGYRLLTGVRLYIEWSKLSQLTFYELSIVGIMLTAIAFTVFTRSRLAAVAAMGVVGFALCLLFVFYSAPDLAMTQFAIDTLTVILFVLVLFRLPRYLPFSRPRARFRDSILATIFGVLIMVVLLEVLNEKMVPEVGNYYAENAYLMAKGKNVVNVILVDFRGMDTLIEVSVLMVAGVGVFGLLKLRMGKKEDKI